MKNRNSQIVRLYQGGLSSTKIAHKFGLGVTRVLTILKQRGIKRRKFTVDKQIIERAKKAVRLYESGLSMEEAAQAVGLKSASYSSKWLKRFGVTSRISTIGKVGRHSRAGVTKPLDEMVSQLHCEGLKLHEIAERVNRCVKTVINSLNRLGLPRKCSKFKSRKPSPRDRKILRMIPSLGVAETAHQTGLSKQRISQIKARWSNPLLKIGGAR